MERVINFIPNIVNPFKALFVLALFLTIILMVQGIIYYFIQDSTSVWQGTCSFKEWGESRELRMVVDCGEHGEGNLRNGSFLLSYLNNPGPLICELSATDNISCENRPPLEDEGG
jgi:hypothetical protein